MEKALTVGDLIGRAIRIYRLNIKAWLPILIWPTIICVLGRVILQGSLAIIPENNTGINPLILALTAIVGFAIWLITKWILLVRQLAFVRLANGFSETLSQSVDFVQKKQWSVLGATLVVMFIFIAVSGLWFLELIASGLLYKRDSMLAIASSAGILFGVVVGSLSCCFIWYVFFVILSGLACENSSLTLMVSRGFKLAGKAIWRTFGLGTLISFTTYFISFPLWIPPLLLIGLDALRMGAEFSPANDIPIHWQVISCAWEPMVEMIIWPITFLAYGLFYYDLRLRQEAVDVAIILEKEETKAKSEASFL